MNQRLFFVLLGAGVLSIVPSLVPARGEVASARFVKANVLAVRRGPSVDYRASGVLFRGDRVSVLDFRSGWSQVRVGAATGWVKDRYLAATPPRPRPLLQASSVGLLKLPGRTVGLRRLSRISRAFGHPRLVCSSLRAGRDWAARQFNSSKRQRIRIKDLGKSNGRPTGIIDEHSRGLEFDLEPIGASRIGARGYDRARTARMLNVLRRSLPVSKVRGDRRIPDVSRQRPFKGHELHVEIRG